MATLKYVLQHPIGALRLLYDYQQQNGEFRNLNTEAESLIVFVVPAKNRISGGTMSIFSLATAAKEVRDVHRSEVMLVTFPGKLTYFKNDFFISRETAFRFSQIGRFTRLKKIMIHLPEFLADKFYDALSKEEKSFLAAIDDVHINIMNQNIESMPPKEALAPLKKLTGKLTQTTAHDRYGTQEVCNRYDFPLHHFSVFIDLSPYPRVPFEEKEKIVLLSPDKAPCREQVVDLLKKNLPDYRLITVRNMTFANYMKLASKARFSLTFGEGFDGYLIHAAVVDSLGFAVYNENFFPDRSYAEMGNIYRSYDDLLENLVKDIRELETDKARYKAIVAENMKKIDSLYGYDKFLDNQRRFYRGQYDFYPVAGE